MDRLREMTDPRDPTQAPVDATFPRAGNSAHPRSRFSPWWVGGLALTLLLATGHVPAAFAQDELYVTNASNNSVTVYTRTATGDVAPLRTIGGGATGLNSPFGLAVDTVNNEIIVANFGNSITVYSRTASGNVAPLRTIGGGMTGLNNPIGLAVDTVNNEIAVTNLASITVYSRTASGNVAPLRTIGGGMTGLNSPFGLAVDTVNNEIAVTNTGNTSITVYSRTADGNAAPLRTIQGAATGLNNPIGLALDTVNNEIAVANFADRITVYSRTASGNVAPLRAIGGLSTGLNEAFGLALDTVNNEIAVANMGNNSVTVHSRTANGDTAPLRTISGGATGLSGPSFPAVIAGTSPTATVTLNGSGFHTGQVIAYEATLSPGFSPIQVDIYLGALLPDGATFLSLVQVSPGGITFSLGPAPIAFQADVTLTSLAVPFQYTFTGFEPVGTYFTYAGLAVAGSEPLLPGKQLALDIQPFQFSP